MFSSQPARQTDRQGTLSSSPLHASSPREARTSLSSEEHLHSFTCSLSDSFFFPRYISLFLTLFRSLARSLTLTLFLSRSHSRLAFLSRGSACSVPGTSLFPRVRSHIHTYIHARTHTHTHSLFLSLFFSTSRLHFPPVHVALSFSPSRLRYLRTLVLLLSFSFCLAFAHDRVTRLSPFAPSLFHLNASRASVRTSCPSERVPKLHTTASLTCSLRRRFLLPSLSLSYSLSLRTSSTPRPNVGIARGRRHCTHARTLYTSRTRGRKIRRPVFVNLPCPSARKKMER